MFRDRPPDEVWRLPPARLLLRKHVPSSSNPSKSGWSSFLPAHQICSADCISGHLKQHEIGDLCSSPEPTDHPHLETDERPLDSCPPGGQPLCSVTVSAILDGGWRTYAKKFATLLAGKEPGTNKCQILCRWGRFRTTTTCRGRWVTFLHRA